MSFLEAEAAEKVGEVFVLIEALIEIGRKGKAFEVLIVILLVGHRRTSGPCSLCLNWRLSTLKNRDYLRVPAVFDSD